LDTIGKEVDLLATVTNYYDKVLAFYQWFQSRQEEVIAADFRAFMDKQTELVLLELEDNIDFHLANKQEMHWGEGELFHLLFDLDEFAALANLLPDSPERADLALQFLEERFSVPARIKKKIRKLYREPGFSTTNPLQTRDEHTT